jgi:hypothetical protein
VRKEALPNLLLHPESRRANEAWLAKAEEMGKQRIVSRRTFWANKLKDSLAVAVNAAKLADEIAERVSTGRLDPAQGIQHLRELKAEASRAEQTLPQVQEQVAIANNADPLTEFDTLMETFPALASRFPAPPLIGPVMPSQ